MGDEELENLKGKLSNAPLDWELRLALIQAHVLRGQMDEAKCLVRESPDAAGPAPAQFQYRLHRLMTEGRSAAEEFAREDGFEVASDEGQEKGRSHQPIEVEVISAKRDEGKETADKLIEVEIIPVREDRPVGTDSLSEGLPGSAESMSGVIEDTNTDQFETISNVDATEGGISESCAVDPKVEENPMKRVDYSVKQKELKNSCFVIESVEQFTPSNTDSKSNRKASALGIACLVHLILAIILTFIVVSAPRPNPPMIVAVNAAEDQVLDVPKKRVEQVKRPKLSSASAPTTMVLTSSAVSPVTIANFDVSDVSYLPTSMIGFGNGVGKSGAGTGAGDRTGSIGGMKIKSRRLGVVLDVSGSMDRQIRAVRVELRKSFSTARVVEVVGCSLDWNKEDPGFDLQKAKMGARFKKNADSVVEAVEILITSANVDAIFWFSDLMDTQTKAGEQRLANLLGTRFGSDRRPVKFYVQSVDREPSPALTGIAKRSGGGVKVKKF